MLDRWITRALRSRLEPFIKAARTMRDRRTHIVNAIEHDITNARVEGLNTKPRRSINWSTAHDHYTQAIVAITV